jgi:hypothetical protein
MGCIKAIRVSTLKLLVPGVAVVRVLYSASSKTQPTISMESAVNVLDCTKLKTRWIVITMSAIPLVKIFNLSRARIAQ